MRKLLAFVFGAFALIGTSFAVATDGTIVNYGADTDVTWKWVDGIKAKDGGTMYVNGNYGSPVHWITIGSAITLNSIFHNSRGLLSYGGQQITLVGDPAVMDMPIPYDHSNEGFERRSAWITAQITGTGANTYVKRGGGKWSVKKPLTNFAEIYIEDGGLVSTNISGAAVSECPIRIGSGYLGYQPDYQMTGGAYSNTASSTGIKIEAGAQITLNKVNADSATLTVGPLARLDGGSLLVRSSRCALGDTERLLMLGDVPTNKVSCLVAPWIVTRWKSETGSPVRFLKYDALAGLLPFSDYLTAFTDSTKDDAVRISAATTVAAATEASAAAVEVNNADQLVVNGTLKLGDGTNPGAIALNSTGTSDQTFEGTGTIDFGDKPGLVWRGATGGMLSLATKFKGTGGVTVGSGGSCDYGTEKPSTSYATAKPTFNLGKIVSNAWVEQHIFDGVTGGIHLTGGTFRFGRGCFGPNDVYLEGNNTAGSSSLQYWDYASGSITNHFHLRGDYALAVNGVKAGNVWTFDAPVTLTGNVHFYPQAQGFFFNRAIDGTGDLTVGTDAAPVNGSHLKFCAANTYDGKTTLNGYSSTKPLVVLLSGNGTFGTGDVVAGSYTSLKLSGLGGYTMTQKFSCGGSVEIANSRVDFLGKTSFAATTMTGGEIGIGADVSFGTAYVGSGIIKPAATASKLTIAGDTTFAATMTDVSGKTLDLVKTGEGEAVLCAPAGGTRNTAKGKLRIEGGTVRLVSDPLKSSACSLWLDMDDDACVTMSGNEITSFTSKSLVPCSCAFNSGSKMTRTNTINGHRVATAPDAAFSKYLSDAAKTLRTVFVVCRPTVGNAKEGDTEVIRGLFGFSNDHGIRMASATLPDHWANKIGHASYKQGDDNVYMYINGAKGSAFTVGETQIVELRVPQEDETNIRATLAFPRCSGAKPFQGDIAEIIAFDCELSDDEFGYVNDYLAAKWLGAAEKPAPMFPSALPAETAVELTMDATLDLDGSDQTLASLTGKGKVINSSATPVTLTVTDTFDGTISVGAGVNVVHPGSATYRVYNDGPMTNDLVYWFDASKRETVFTNAAGCVTNWLSRAGKIKEISNFGEDSKKGVIVFGRQYVTPPDYVAADPVLGNRPGIRFDSMDDSLYTSNDDAGKSTVRTVFVMKYDSANTWTDGGNPFTWTTFTGWNDNYYGLFYSGANNAAGRCYNNYHSMAFEYVSDHLRATFADAVLTPDNYGGGLVVGPRSGQPYVLSVRVAATNPHADFSLRHALGAFDRGVGFWQTVCEVIAYDRQLSDGEMEQVEAYLLDKWITGSGIPAETDTVTLSGTVTVPVGADGSIAPVRVEGKLDASGATLAVTDARNVPKGASRDLLVADEVTEGFSSTTSDWKRLQITLEDGVRYVGRCIKRGVAVFAR